MAKTVVTSTEYTDDLDGGKADGTISFAFDGQQYEIDLSKANTRAFEKAVKPYREAARVVRGQRKRGNTRGRASGPHDLGAIRIWARANGHQVSERGRISMTVIDAYNASSK